MWQKHIEATVWKQEHNQGTQKRDTDHLTTVQHSKLEIDTTSSGHHSNTLQKHKERKQKCGKTQVCLGPEPRTIPPHSKSQDSTWILHNAHLHGLFGQT